MGQLSTVPAIHPKYLVKDKDRHGNLRWYVRKRGQPKIRIRAAEGSLEFWDEYRDALSGRTPFPTAGAARRPTVGRASPNSLRWLCEQYMKSAAYKRLDARTRYVRKGVIDRLCKRENDGDKPFRLMEPRHIRVRCDEMYEHPEAANAYLKAMRAIFKFAKKDGLCERDIAKEVEYFRTNSDGWHTWTDDEMAKFQERHPVGTKARLALAILHYTGVRRSDVVSLGEPMVSEDGEGRRWLTFIEFKGRNRKPKQQALPILLEFQMVLDASSLGDGTWLETEFGKPYTSNGFGNWFKRQCIEAGLPHCTAHGIRKHDALTAIEQGATDRQTMSIFGWTTPKQIATYARKASNRKLAADAMHLIVRRPPSAKSVPPSASAQIGETKSAPKGLKNKKDGMWMVPRAGVNKLGQINGI